MTRKLLLYAFAQPECRTLILTQIFSLYAAVRWYLRMANTQGRIKCVDIASFSFVRLCVWECNEYASNLQYVCVRVAKRKNEQELKVGRRLLQHFKINIFYAFWVILQYVLCEHKNYWGLVQRRNFLNDSCR